MGIRTFFGCLNRENYHAPGKNAVGESQDIKTTFIMAVTHKLLISDSESTLPNDHNT